MHGHRRWLRAASQAVRQWGAAHGFQADALRADAPERAARLAIERRLDHAAVLNLMLGSVREALPDAIVALGASGTALRNRAVAKLTRAKIAEIKG